MYPFEFSEMLLTSRALDKLGFTEYWAGSGDFGTRSFGILLNDGSNNRYEKDKWIQIIELDEKDDDCDGYCSDKWYAPCRYIGKYTGSIYFLHELYEELLAQTPHLEEYFLEQCTKCNMINYINSYLEYKAKMKAINTSIH